LLAPLLLLGRLLGVALLGLLDLLFSRLPLGVGLAPLLVLVRLLCRSGRNLRRRRVNL